MPEKILNTHTHTHKDTTAALKNYFPNDFQNHLEIESLSKVPNSGTEKLGRKMDRGNSLGRIKGTYRDTRLSAPTPSSHLWSTLKLMNVA